MVARRPAVPPDRERVKAVVEEVCALNLPPDSFWEMVEERLGLEHGDAFHFIAADPVFYGFAGDEPLPPRRRL